MKRKDLLLEQVDKLRKIKLPKGWEVAKLDVVFHKKGETMYDNANVIYDSLNGCFYVKTVKSIVYEKEANPMLEAIKVMRSANRIIK